MTIRRQPFSARIGLTDPEEETLYEGVPNHLVNPLRTWLKSVFSTGHGARREEIAQDVAVRLRITVPANQYATVWLAGFHEEDLLNVIDEVLLVRSLTRFMGPSAATELEVLLALGGSAYRVNQAGDGLETRVASEVRAAVDQAIAVAEQEASSGSAAEHLSTAWKAAYGRNPDPGRAYSESIKAVECAAHSVIQTNHGRATMGTMLGELDGARSKFALAIPTPPGKDPVAPIEAMMRTLWDGQTSRHGKQTPTNHETLEAARAAVHLAAALVQLFSSGAVTRNP
ncbi:hypothetical protein [Streptomyces sp. Isolate_45]|uniref:hypothetical protein n=1 Tax=Streptomyces sp. Isolate_45 TaxID=2950111 RepID=UPI002481C500|nr:hypothetical protein [Streptomyces sp. Isolate_45]MDA5284624.1 hypothetical protein [Streptomyces sp. Isolate_45]